MVQQNHHGFFLFLTAMLIFIIISLHYNLQLISRHWFHRTFYLTKSSPSPTNANIERKIILFTTKWWQGEFPYLKEANAFCPKCYFTANESMWSQSDAIVFHGRMLNQSVPSRRKREEIWVMMNLEINSDSEQETKFYNRMKLYDGLFNWTMTFRRDSDIFVPYGKFVPIKENARPETNEVWAFLPGARLNKTYEFYNYVVTPSIKNFKNRKMSAWIASRCSSLSRREDKIKGLSKYIDIDIYGDSHCATKRCFVPKWKALTGVDCRLQIHGNYKLYFAFESSLCKDYVTEMFFDTAMTEMVPVVYGGADYRAMFPKNSFINVDDFRSLKDLAEYLKYLSKHPKEWLRYFEWRKEFWVQTNRFVSGYCHLCQKLWEVKDEQQDGYQSVADWWSFVRPGEPVCSLPKAAFNIKLVPYFSKHSK